MNTFYMPNIVLCSKDAEVNTEMEQGSAVIDLIC